jgi:ABC-type multidrug transport system ATPase subunit
MTMTRAVRENLSLCPYCNKELDTAEATVCPHCGLPLRRRKRRQATAHGGVLAKLIVDLPGHGQQEHFLSKKSTSLGRHADNLIRIDSPLVADHQAEINLSRTGHTITDLGSPHHTRVNGQALTPHKPHPLVAQDIIRFSDDRGNSIKLTYLAPSGFTHVHSKDAGHSFQLDGDISYIGRGFDATIVLSHPTVSWQHTKITKQADNQYLIEDVSTQNGTFINDSRLQQTQLLKRGDVIRIGPFNLIYQDEGQFSSFFATRNFRLEVENLEKTVYETNTYGFADRNRPLSILSGLNLVINPREFVALVGSSGSGKSTLMKALIGLSPATGGKVLVNGDDLYANLQAYRHLIGYVPQDDIIHHNLRVRQALRYALQLRAPDTNPVEAEKQIDEVLAKVGLTAQAETIVHHLSGGQRKRVSIAAELLADPWIFFLDEPTSNLDPGLEKLMMDTLRQLADEGRTIVLITHATNHILDHCDQLVFMAAGGHLAYFGPPDQAAGFFHVDHIPDIYTALHETYPANDETAIPTELQASYRLLKARNNHQAPTIEAGLLWAEDYHQSELYDTYVTHRQSGEVARPLAEANRSLRQNTASQVQQFKVLARRYLDLLKADRRNLWVLLALMPLIGLFLLLISDSRALVGHPPAEITARLETSGHYSIATQTQTVLFLMTLSTALLGIFGAAYEFVKEEVIYRRERMIGLKVWPYFSSKFVVLGLFMAGQVVLLLAVLALKVRFPWAGAFTWAPLEFYVTLLLTILAGIALGLFISALASSKEMVTSLILITVLIQIVFSGAIFELSGLTEPLSYLTISRWSLEALGISTDIAGLNDLGQVRVETALDTGRGLQTLVEDVPTTIDFFVDYTRNGLGLAARWIFLVAHIFVWSRLTIWQLRRKDEVVAETG